MTTADTIKQSVYEIKKQRSHLRVRLNVIRTIKRATVRRAENHESFSDDEIGSWDRVLENLEDIDANFSDYVLHLEAELQKVGKGLRKVAAIENEEGKAALEEYISEDVSITIKNLRKARKEFDEAIEVVRQLKDMEM